MAAHALTVAAVLNQNTQNLYYAAYNAAVIAGASWEVLQAIDTVAAPMLAKAESAYQEQLAEIPADCLAAPYTPVPAALSA